MLSRQNITGVIHSRGMEPGILIKTERLKRGWSQADLAKEAGISQPAIKKIEAGDTKQSKYLPKIASVLNIPLPKLDRSLTQHGDETVNYPKSVNGNARIPPLNKLPIADLMGDVDLPVYAIAQGGRGALVLENEPFTHISRPLRLIGKRDGYGVLIIGDSMAREYNEGDTAYVDPHLPPRKGDPCVFQGTRPDGSVEAIIKYLDRSPDANDALYYVSQSNPEKNFTIKKADWQKCHVLVGKESGR